MLALLTRFRRTRRPPEPRPDDHVAAAVHAAPPGECDRVTPPAPTPPEASPHSAIVPKPPEPARYPALSPAAVTSPRGGKLDALTAVLGRQKAGQALWAPNRLTAAERQQAEQVLKRFR
jgi:hypothetical protein